MVKRRDFFKVMIVTAGWMIAVAAVIALTIKYLPFTPTFPYYNQDLASLYSRFWSTFAHFDGIHYLRIASSGRYPDGGEVAFFPLYPLLVHGLVNLGLDRLFSGILLSNLFLFLALLILRDVYQRASWKFSLLLLTFPMSFFFGVVYTESLFILLFALMLWFLKRKNYLLAALVVALSTATRFVGIGMAIYFILSIWGKLDLKKFFVLAASSFMGLVGYMVYLGQTVGDPLAFVHVQPSFGMGRSGGEIILLPQVLFRYAKIIFLVTPDSLVYWRAAFELVVFSLVVFVLIKYFRKLSKPELVYVLIVLLIPTLSGTLSSYPRYIMAALPLFRVVAESLSSQKAILTALFQVGFFVISLILFTQGLFIA